MVAAAAVVLLASVAPLSAVESALRASLAERYPSVTDGRSSRSLKICRPRARRRSFFSAPEAR